VTVLLPESLAMRIAGMLGLKKTWWSLRRLHVPVSDDALVLEVGSGGNPYPRANVLLDAYEETRERHWAPLVHDRPTMLAFGEKLPFKDKVFDFVIAVHVLEHTPNPEIFLAELQRVARAGYIETPDAFMERINPYRDHRLEVTVRDGGLVIRKKTAWIVDTELNELYERRAKRWVTEQLIPRHPADFHVCFYWKDGINFRIVNPEVDASWKPVLSEKPAVQRDGMKQIVRFMGLALIRWIFSQGRRNRRIDLLPLLCCTRCGGSELTRQTGRIACEDCDANYPVERGIIVMHNVASEESE
jgi:SAM-dependent methyltransferase